MHVIIVYYFYYENDISRAAFILNFPLKRMILRKEFVDVRVNFDIFLSQSPIKRM